LTRELQQVESGEILLSSEPIYAIERLSRLKLLLDVTKACSLRKKPKAAFGSGRQILSDILAGSDTTKSLQLGKNQDPKQSGPRVGSNVPGELSVLDGETASLQNHLTDRRANVPLFLSELPSESSMFLKQIIADDFTSPLHFAARLPSSPQPYHGQPCSP
jgi:hypothetical protein